MQAPIFLRFEHENMLYRRSPHRRNSSVASSMLWKKEERTNCTYCIVGIELQRTSLTAVSVRGKYLMRMHFTKIRTKQEYEPFSELRSSIIRIRRLIFSTKINK